MRVGRDPHRVPAGAHRVREGNLWFGDGGLRLVTPFSPASRLGASHVMAIGVRSQRAAESLQREELAASEEGARSDPCARRSRRSAVCS